MAVRYDSNSSSDSTNDDSGLVMRLFGTAVFVVDGAVMPVSLWDSDSYLVQKRLFCKM